MRKFLLASSVLALPLLLTAHAQAAACSASDLSLTIGSTTYTPSQCADGVDNGKPNIETANMNTALKTSGFTYLDTSGAASSSGIGGIVFTVTAPQTSSGNWTVSWVDTNGSLPLNLPIEIDFEVYLFGGNNGSAYLLRNLLLPTDPNTGTGFFEITFTNGGGNQPGLSHLTLAGGNARLVGVPEPASMALLGVGMIGTGVMARRRRQATSTPAAG